MKCTEELSLASYEDISRECLPAAAGPGPSGGWVLHGPAAWPAGLCLPTGAPLAVRQKESRAAGGGSLRSPQLLFPTIPLESFILMKDLAFF